MKTPFLISTFFMTILFANSNAISLETEQAWKAAADNACQSVCQEPTAKSIPTSDGAGSIVLICDTACSCGKDTNLPDQTECIAIVRSGPQDLTSIVGKCTRGQCDPFLSNKRR